MKRYIIPVLILLAALGGYHVYHNARKCTIYVNNEPLVSVSDRKTADEIIGGIKAAYREKYGEKTEVTENVSIENGASEKLSEAGEARALLEKTLTPGRECFAVIADGTAVCGFENKEDAGRFLVYSKEKFTPSSGEYEEPEFREKVLIDATLISPDKIYASPEEAFEGVFRNKASARKGSVHKVKKGETASQIARKHSMKLKELARLNPGFNLNRLKPGDILNISGGSSPACLTVIVRLEQTVTESVKPKTTRVSSEILPYGKTKVLNPGKPGRKKTRYALCFENGRQVSKETVSEEYLELPVNREVAVGIKAAVP